MNIISYGDSIFLSIEYDNNMQQKSPTKQLNDNRIIKEEITLNGDSNDSQDQKLMYLCSTNFQKERK